MMIRKLFRTTVIIVTVAIIGGSFILESRTSIGKPDDQKKGLVTYADGRVKKRAGKSADWINAEINSAVNSGDRLRTYQRSRAELELIDLDVIRMAPETTIDIVKLYEETKGKLKETKIDIQEGDIWANLEKKDSSVKFDITTPVAGAAITGTVFRMNVKQDSTTELKVYNGEVKVTNAPEKLQPDSQKTFQKPHEVPGPQEVPGPKEVSLDEWVYIVKNMQKIVIDNSGNVQSYGDFNAADPDEQTEWVQWNLQRDNAE